MTYPKTLTALNRLESSLTCTQCHRLRPTLCTLGACEHLFCRDCCNTLLGTSCPECKIPVHVKDAQVNRQMSNLVSLCRELGRILVSNSHGDYSSAILEKETDLTIQEIQESTPNTSQQFTNDTLLSSYQQNHGNTQTNDDVINVKDTTEQMDIETRRKSGQRETARQRKHPFRSTRLRHTSGDVAVNSNGDDLMGGGQEEGCVSGKVEGGKMETQNGNVTGRPGRKPKKDDSMVNVHGYVKVKRTSRSVSRSGRGRNQTLTAEKMLEGNDETDNEENIVNVDARKTRPKGGDSGCSRSRSRTRGREANLSMTERKRKIQDESSESESDDSDHTVTKKRRQPRNQQRASGHNTQVGGRRKQPQKAPDQSTMTQFFDDENGGEESDMDVSDDADTKKRRGWARKRQGSSDKKSHDDCVKKTKRKETEKPVNQSTMTQFYEYDDNVELPLLEIPDEAEVKKQNKKIDMGKVSTGQRSRSVSRKRSSPNKNVRRGRSKDQASNEDASILSSPVSDLSSVGSVQRSSTGKKQGKKISKKSPVLKTIQNRTRQSLGGSQGDGQVKKNARGETPLHLAAIKGDVDKVKTLLESGAKPNVRDNAGWTPLHECCNHGYTVIVELLLIHGAKINIPGMENDTPLHDAVSNYRLDVVKLLVSRGASVSARNIHGKTPLDLARTEEMRHALNTPVTELSFADASVLEGEDEFQPLCFLGTALSRDDGIKLQKCAAVLHAKVVDTFTPEVSHLITSCNQNGQCPRTLKYLHGVLSGKWIISIEWLDLCLEYNQKVCEEAFEVPGSSTNPDSQAASKGRLNKRQQFPGLFDGCQFYFHGTFSSPTPEKEELQNLVKSGGGKILSREPKLHNIDDYIQTVPYHAEESSTLKDCGLFIVHDKNTTYPPINSSRLCAVPANWIMDCIASFSLLDPPSVSKTSFSKQSHSS